MQCSTSGALSERQVVESLAAHFSRLTDQRTPRGVRYALAPLLVMLVLAKLCEADTPQAIAQWVEYRAAWLTEALHVSWRRMPHPATWRRLLAQAVDVPELEPAASQYLARLAQPPAPVLNLDGKTLRGTIPKGATQGLHLLAVQQPAANCVVRANGTRPT